MRFVDEYRDPTTARALVAQITTLAGDHSFKFMEVCGGHTHTIYRHGIEHVLPANVELVHGPGCPVCVIPMGRVDDAIAVALEPNVIFTSFGDMIRVPGSEGNLLEAKANGADVRFVYSPLDALRVAVENPERDVVFFAVGFETTAPSTALTLLEARARGVTNFFVFSNHVTIVPPLRAILESPDLRLDGFLGPGHVSTVVGQRPYRFVPAEYGLPLVTAGFEPIDILHAIAMLLTQISEGRCEVENQYARVVREAGNPRALAVLAEVFELRPHFEWRGLGFIAQSGLKLRPEFAAFDAELRFTIPNVRVADPKACQCGEVLEGVIKPWECKVFGTACTPETPIGTCMVSSEGACAAYYNFGRMHREAAVTLGRRSGRRRVTGLVAMETAIRLRLRVTGLVQGVGFRPHVHRLATGLGLAGHVGNDTEGVFAEVEGPAEALDEFLARLVAQAPAAARVDGVASARVPATGRPGFAIAESRGRVGARTFVSPDLATCDDCLAELFDPADRRARYPFINCTNCGPRFTITLRLPYDRPNTTMRGFALCEDCAAEYEDPTDRRFHAQPVACVRCGPRLWFEGPDAAGGAGAGRVEGSDAALAAAQAALARGEIVAIKGLGGYHLACDARSDKAVERLRVRKQRLEKPFAVMVRDLAAADTLAELGAAERALLSSIQRPIVLLRRRTEAGLSALVAPGNPRVGVLLPYTPLHHLLFAPVPGAAPGTPAPPDRLVMTSGNLTDEPICFEDADARERLGAIADAWLVHDRPIHVPCDDSVLLVDLDTGEELPLRRSRGYAPLPLRLPFAAPPTLAVGGELKNTFCLAAGRDAFMSQHIGDMGSLETRAAFERSTDQLATLYGIDAALVVADAHPGYQTRRWAEMACEDAGSSATLLAEVQHHHAHIASVMAEHGVPLDQRVIGVAFDGTGYGDDGTIWGGEILVAGYRDAERAGSLVPVPLPGGDTAIRRPCRVALAHLWAAGIEWSDDLAPVAALGADERAVLERQLSRGVGTVATSSMGRLFDAVSSLVGLCHQAGYEAQAAMELQWAAEAALDRNPFAAPPYRFEMTGAELQPAPVLLAIVADRRAGVDVGAMAAGFHAAVARAVGDAAASVHTHTGIDVVALSGGVFQNTLLLELTRRELATRGFGVLTHQKVPPNDGGLALGQVVVAAARASSEGIGA